MSNNEKIVVLFTCFNRKEKTINAIKRIKESIKNVSFVIVDDASTDGTVDEIKKIQNISAKIISGNGNLFYSGGMRKGMEYLLNKKS